MGFFKSIGRFFTGTPAKRENVSTLRPEQEGLYNQLIGAGKAPGAGGAFGEAADYYRSLLNDDDSADYNAFTAPALRQYNQDIVPGLSEQFAGMGAGNLSSSGFRNAQMQGATDLAERLGSIRANLRANLRQAGAAGLVNIGNAGLQSFSQNMETRPGTPGFLAQAAPLIGTAAATAVGGPMGGALANMGSNWFGGGGNRVGQNTSPYGNATSASPKPTSSNGFNLPNFQY